MRKPTPNSLQAIDMTCPECGQPPAWGCIGTPNAGPHQARIQAAKETSQARNKAAKERAQ